MKCKNCSRQLRANEAVRLWDDEHYCRPCVEAVCPGLSSYAETHERLEELLEFRFARVLRTWAQFILAMWFAAMIFLSLIVVCGVAVTANTGILPEALYKAAKFSGTIPAVFLAVTPFMVFGCWLAYPHTFYVAHGRVGIATHRSTTGPSAPLARAKWRVARTRRDCDGGWCIAPREAVIIRYRIPEYRHLIRPFTIVINSCPEARRRWQGFLELAGVPKSA